MQDSRKVVNFGRIKTGLELPNLIEIQLKSYDWFLQPDAVKKKPHGLQAVFEEIFTIESPHEDVVLEFIDYEIGQPKYSELESKERDVTYAAPLKATIRLIRKDSMEVREQSVYMGDIPLMTPRGTFIINGAERVVVNQLHRSPGIFFFYEEAERIYNYRVIPDRGSWLEFEMDPKGYIIARIDRKKKFPVTLLIKALGYETNEELVKLFYNTKTIHLRNDEDYESLNGKRVASDVANKQTGEVIMEVGERITMDMVDRIKEEKIKHLEVIEFPNNKEDSFLSTTLEIEKEFINKHVKSTSIGEHKNSELALLTIHAIMWQSEPTNLENASEHFNRLFFDPKTYSLGAVGRYKISTKFGIDDFETQTLRPEDIVYSLKYFLYLIAEADGAPGIRA